MVPFDVKWEINYVENNAFLIENTTNWPPKILDYIQEVQLEILKNLVLSVLACCFFYDSISTVIVPTYAKVMPNFIYVKAMPKLSQTYAQIMEICPHYGKVLPNFIYDKVMPTTCLVPCKTQRKLQNVINSNKKSTPLSLILDGCNFLNIDPMNFKKSRFVYPWS